MKVIWSPVSLVRFEEIEYFLRVNYGNKIANEFSVKLLYTIRLISQNPGIGKKVNSNIRSLVVVKQISIHYKVTTQIEVLTLWDNRQLPIY